MTPAAEAALDSMTREQLYAVIRQARSAVLPGMFRATDNALRSAIRTYVRIGRLTEAQVYQPPKEPQPCSKS